MVRIPDDPRAATYMLDAFRDYIRHLELARSRAKNIGLETHRLEGLLIESLAVENQLRQKSAEQITSRGRSKKTIRPEGASIPNYYMYLDECGSHVVGPRDHRFPAFSLTGVIFSEENYRTFEEKWKSWKLKVLGIDDPKMHEPDLRTYAKRFHRKTDEERVEIDRSLEQLLAELEFHCISTVVDLHSYSEQYPAGRVDDYLPRSTYLMAIDFIMERFVHFLREFGNDARGHVVAESRGSKEDTLVSYEYVRLQKEGTQFISESDFRYQLRPYIEFKKKSANVSGLQLADIAARPFAEKVLDPNSTPKRWDIFSSKLYDGCKNESFSYGLKIFPLTEHNDPLKEQRQKKKEMRNASPSSD